MAVRNLAHVQPEFGSKATHCVPRSMDCSMKMNNLRILTYLHVESDDMMRAPTKIDKQQQQEHQ